MVEAEGAAAYILRDLDSTNGVRVNGQPVTEARLRPGDRLRLGSVEGVFEPEQGQRGQLLTLDKKPAVALQEPAPGVLSARPGGFSRRTFFSQKKSMIKNFNTATHMLAGIAALLCLLGILMCFLFISAPKVPAV